MLDIPFNNPISTPTPIPTKAYIKLPPGKWIVTVNLLLQANNDLSKTNLNPWAWLRFSFNEANTIADAKTLIPNISTATYFSGAKLVSGVFMKGPSGLPGYIEIGIAYSMLNGQVVINNSSTIDKYYGLVYMSSDYNIVNSNFKFMSIASSYNGENQISAIRIQ